MTTHFWNGNKGYSVAFVFSAPGRVEGDTGRPAAGDTGTNMNHILQELNRLKPEIFPSSDRYDYLITNASPRVLYAKKDNGMTEDKIKNITDPKNITRIMHEITSCSIVILCGKRAQKIEKYIKNKTVITCCHFGNKGLRNTYNNKYDEMKGMSSSEREIMRRLLCAKAISQKIK